MLCSTDESAKHEQRYFHVLEEHRVDGLLVCPVDSDLESAVALVARGIPTVLLDRDGSSHGLCSTAVDDIRGAELAADHLFDLGHEAIALVNGPATIRQCIDRLGGRSPVGPTGSPSAISHGVDVDKFNAMFFAVFPPTSRNISRRQAALGASMSASACWCRRPIAGATATSSRRTTSFTVS